MKPSATAPAGVTDPGGGRDGHEAGQDARGDAEAGGLAVVDGLDAHPRQRAAAAAAACVTVSACAVSTPLDSELPALNPNQPTHSRPDAHHHHDQVVGMHGRARVAAASAQVERGDEAADAGRDVHDGATREVDGPELEQEAIRRPDPVRQRAVHEHAPQGDEDDVAAEPDALGEGARDEGRGDDGELALEHGEHEVGDAVAADRAVDAAEEHEPRIPADPAAQRVRAEGEGVADHDPDDAHDGHRGEAVQHRAQDVLRAHQAAVEHGQAGHHEQHEGRRGEHPGRGARIDGRLLGQRCGVGGGDADGDGDAQDGQQRHHGHDDLAPGLCLGAEHLRVLL